MKKILITGASGFVGKNLLCKLFGKYEIYALSRIKRESKDINWITWDELNKLPKDLYAVVNLMGENIAGFLWTKNQKKKIFESRVSLGNQLISELKNNNIKIEKWIQASAIGYYGKKELVLSEEEHSGSGFLGYVCRSWEKVIENEYLNSTNKSIIRISLVLDKNGGMIERIKPIFKLGLGGKLGDGNQKMSWIALEDLISLIEFLIENESNGIFNAVSPEVVDNKQFTKVLGEYFKRPTIFPVPKFILKTLLGELSGLLLDSQEVKSKNLELIGFKFKYPKLKDKFSI